MSEGRAERLARDDEAAQVVVCLHRLAEVSSPDAADSPTVAAAVADVMRVAHDYAMRRGSHASLAFAGGRAYLGRQLLRGDRRASEAAGALAAALGVLDATEVTIAQDIPASEARLLGGHLAAARTGRRVAPAPMADVRLRTGASRLADTVVGASDGAGSRLRGHAAAVVAVRRARADMARGRVPSLGAVRRGAEALVELCAESDSMLALVGPAPGADDAVRAVRSTLLALRAVRASTQDRGPLLRVALAGLLLDAGKARLQVADTPSEGRPRTPAEQLGQLPAATMVSMLALLGMNDVGQRAATLAYEAWHVIAGTDPYGGFWFPSLLARVIAWARRLEELRSDVAVAPNAATIDAFETLSAEAADPGDHDALRLLAAALPKAAWGVSGVGAAAPPADDDDLLFAGAVVGGASAAAAPSVSRDKGAETTPGVQGRSPAAPPVRDGGALAPPVREPIAPPVREPIAPPVREPIAPPLRERIPIAMPERRATPASQPTSSPAIGAEVRDDEVADGREPTAQGSIEKTPFVHLLVYALERVLSGTTVFESADGPCAAIYFHTGVPSKVRTWQTVWPLDRTLLEMGVLDEAALLESLRVVSRTRSLHGRHLVARGQIDENTLRSTLRRQLGHKLRWMCELPPSTRYAYYDGVNLLESYGGPDLTPTEPLAHVMVGARMRAGDRTVQQTLGRLGTTPLRLHADAAPERFGLDAEERAVVAALSASPMPLSTLLGRRVASEAAVRATVYALLVTRHLDLSRGQREPIAARTRFPEVEEVGALPPPARGPGELPRRGTRSTDATMGGQPLPRRGTRSTDATMGGQPLPRRGTRSTDATMGGQQPPERGAQPPASARAADLPRRGTQSTDGGPVEAAGPSSRRSRPDAPPPRASAPGGARRAVSPATPAPAPGARQRSEPDAAPDGDRAELTRDAIEERLTALEDENFFEMLEVGDTVTQQELQSAYYRLARLWHPDRLPSQLVDCRAKVSKVFSRLNEAFSTLSDPAKRQHYEQVVGAGGGTAREKEMVARVVDSAFEFQKAEVLFKRGQIALAHAIVERAVASDPDQPEYLTLLAWIEAEKIGAPAATASAAERHRHYAAQIAMLDRVVEREPRYERALYYRGQLLKRAGLDDRAVRDFRAAAGINPRNIDAAREVRLYEMRTKKDDAGGGLLGRLFGKKDTPTRR